MASNNFYSVNSGGDLRQRPTAGGAGAAATALPLPGGDDVRKTQRRGKRGLPLLKLFCAGAALAFALLLWWLSPPLLKAWRNQRSPDHPSEAVFATGVPNEAPKPFPSLFEAPSRTLSVVVPAYNEEERMRIGLDEMLAFLKAKQAADSGFTWEVIVVDDGSKDATAAIALREYVAVHGSDAVRLLSLHRNGGKGAAVRKGVMRARGEWILMADADGATQFSDVGALLAAAKRAQRTGPANADAAGRRSAAQALSFAIGSRAHLADAGSTVKRSALRRFLMWGFHTVIRLLLGGTDIEDTQCGFKLWTRGAARALFPVLHIERWAFDVELVYLAARLGVPMAEVPVTWHEVAGSKLDPASASIQMARDIAVIRLAYATGLWRDTPTA